jgi:hypothetical protein
VLWFDGDGNISVSFFQARPVPVVVVPFFFDFFPASREIDDTYGI